MMRHACDTATLASLLWPVFNNTTIFNKTQQSDLFHFSTVCFLGMNSLSQQRLGDMGDSPTTLRTNIAMQTLRQAHTDMRPITYNLQRLQPLLTASTAGSGDNGSCLQQSVLPKGATWETK